MKFKYQHLLPLLLVTALGLPLTCWSHTEVNVRFEGAAIELGNPPPPMRYEQAPSPRYGYVWAPGFWQWNGHRHVWVDGAWLPAKSGHYWVQERWQRSGNNWHFSPGYWQAREPAIRPQRYRHHEYYSHDSHREHYR